MELADVYAMCVTAFPASASRRPIWNGLNNVLDVLAQQRIRGSLWLDGSFLTNKIDPEDVDIVLSIAASFVEAANPDQQAVLAWLNTNLKASHLCDSYIFPTWPVGDPMYEEGVRRHDYWLKQFGTSRGGIQKGLAVLELGTVSL